MGNRSLAWYKLILGFLVSGQMTTLLPTDEMSCAAAAAEATSMALMGRRIHEQQRQQCLPVMRNCIGSLKL